MSALPAADVVDQHSHANTKEVTISHVDLDLSVDFGRRILEGEVVHRLARRDGVAARELVLDAKHLEIRGCSAGAPGNWHAVSWRLEPGDAIRGSKLVVPITDSDEYVSVSYATTAEGTGLQWLEPAQTAGRRKPFLFSQSQAIHARTWIPCQDTPSARVTYTAKVRCPSDVVAVMSAERSSPVGPGDATFRLSKPIPTYLIALAVGDIEFRAIGKRCGVWAEPSVVERAAREFADTGTMVDAVERLFGAYRWGRYDILVLPPSFPFGGMENPCLTFATPTVLAGDKSGVSLIAHELAHSWSGNLVTNATWRDFWLNEGFTVYLEQRIMEAVFGRERYEMEVLLGMQNLADEMRDLEPRDQILHVDLTGRDPDDGFTQVPYEKGAAFLRLLETRFGRERFDSFLQSWFDEHAFRSVTTEDFVAFLETRLFAKAPDVAKTIDVATWIESSGLPAEAPSATSAAFKRIDNLIAAFRAGVIEADDLAAKGWSTHEWLRFLNGIGKKVALDRLEMLDRAYGLTVNDNSEIRCAWLGIAIGSHYSHAWPRLESFLLGQGRRKFLKPLYTALAADPELKPMAMDIYSRARPLYHAIAVQSIDEVLGR